MELIIPDNAQQELIQKKGVALVEFLTNNSCIKDKEANIHGRDQLTTCERGARSSDNNHLSAGDGGARTAGSPRLIPRWPSPSSSSNTCAPESTPSADSIGDLHWRVTLRRPQRVTLRLRQRRRFTGRHPQRVPGQGGGRQGYERAAALQSFEDSARTAVQSFEHEQQEFTTSPESQGRADRRRARRLV